MTTTLTLTLPDGADQFDAAVFTQQGEWVHCGHMEECEELASDIGGLYCWIDRDRAILRHDYTPAAPDLLASLKACLAILPFVNQDDYSLAVRKAAHVAIDKAEGRRRPGQPTGLTF